MESAPEGDCFLDIVQLLLYLGRYVEFERENKRSEMFIEIYDVDFK